MMLGGALLLAGCGSSPATGPDGGALDAGADDAGGMGGSTGDGGPPDAGPACGPLDDIPFVADPPGTFAGKAGDACTRDIDCLDGTFCYVVKGTCAPASLIEGPGKGGHQESGDACAAAPAFTATCDALSLDWSAPIEVSKSAASLGECDTAVVQDGKGNVLVAWAANSPGLSQKNGLAVSSDGGKSFQPATAPMQAGGEANDAALAVDSQGLFYYVWEGYGPKFQGGQHVYASTSADGKSFGPVLQIDTPGDNGNDTIPLDFPSIAVNPVNDRPYFTYQVTKGSGHVPLKLVVGEKGGASVSPSVPLDDGKRLSPYRDLAKGAFDAQGSFYAAWIELAGSGGNTGFGVESGNTGNAIYFTRVDLGAGDTLVPLGHDVKVSGSGQAVLFGVPELHVSKDGSAVYAVYAVGTKNAIDVHVTVSHDRGLTWDPSVKVNDDATCATHYRPAAALDGKGRLWVLWYDNRDGAGHMAYAVSDDGGKSFHPNRRVTANAFPFETFQYSVGWLGDYFQVTTSAEEIFAAWSDPHDGAQSHVFFTRATLPP